jgi:hypothetical protein
MAVTLNLAPLRVWTESLSGRERVQLIVVALAALGLLAETFVFKPQQRQTQALQAQALAQRAGIAALSRAIAQPRPPRGEESLAIPIAERDALREDVRYAKALIQRAQGDARVGAMARALMTPMRGVTLRSLQTRPSQVFFKPKAPGAAAATASAAQTGLPPTYLHAIDISVDGPYDSLVRFLQRLEAQDPAWLWPTVTLSVISPSLIQLRATVHTLSVSPNAPLE